MSSDCGRSEPTLWVKLLAPLPLLGRAARRRLDLARPWGFRGRGLGGGGAAGVREPRRPRPSPPALSIRLDEPVS